MTKSPETMLECLLNEIRDLCNSWEEIRNSLYTPRLYASATSDHIEALENLIASYRNSPQQRIATFEMELEDSDDMVCGKCGSPKTQESVSLKDHETYVCRGKCSNPGCPESIYEDGEFKSLDDVIEHMDKEEHKLPPHDPKLLEVRNLMHSAMEIIRSSKKELSNCEHKLIKILYLVHEED